MATLDQEKKNIYDAVYALAGNKSMEEEIHKLADAVHMVSSYAYHWEVTNIIEKAIYARGQEAVKPLSQEQEDLIYDMTSDFANRIRNLCTAT